MFHKKKKQVRAFNSGDKIVFIGPGTPITENYQLELGQTYTTKQVDFVDDSIYLEGMANYGFFSWRFMLLSDWEKLPELERLLHDFEG